MMKLIVTFHNIFAKEPYNGRTSIPSAGFEPAIPEIM